MLCRKHMTSGLLFFVFYQLNTIMSQMLLYPLVYILHMGNKMYYKTFSILSLLFGRNLPPSLTCYYYYLLQTLPKSKSSFLQMTHKLKA